MSTSFVFPCEPTGENRRIELAGIDLWITPRIDNVFVYPSKLYPNQLQEALGRSLAKWPLVCGRFLVVDQKRYFIEMSDNAIPVIFVDNGELKNWPLDLSVVLDTAEGRLQPFLDEIPSARLLHGSVDEPLFRLKITNLTRSGECVMGASWAHILGDACACLNFLHTFSQLYQHIEPSIPSPIFERRLWSQNEVDPSLLPTMRHLCDAVPIEHNLQRNLPTKVTHDHMNIRFTGEQLASLHAMANDTTLTVHDVLLAYIIRTMNSTCYFTDDMIIRHTNMIINYRGVSDSIAPSALVANCTLRMLSDTFEDPLSLRSISKSIRKSILRSRNEKYLESWLATADGLMRDMARDELQVNIDPFDNGIVINSNFRYDWANLVDFGHTDQCRFHTDGTTNLFLRIFRLNPSTTDARGIERDRDGAEVAFRMEKNLKKQFVDTLQRDFDEKFVSVKKWNECMT